MIRLTDSSEKILIVADSVVQENYACPSVYSARTEDGRTLLFKYQYGALRVWRYRNRAENGDPVLIEGLVVGGTTDGYINWEQILELTHYIEVPGLEDETFGSDVPVFQTLLNGFKNDPVVQSAYGYYNNEDIPAILVKGGHGGVLEQGPAPFRLEIIGSNTEIRQFSVVAHICGHTEKYYHVLSDVAEANEFIDKGKHRECLQDCALAAYENAQELFQAF